MVEDYPQYVTYFTAFRELEQGFEKARETHFGGRSFNMWNFTVAEIKYTFFLKQVYIFCGLTTQICLPRSLCSVKEGLSEKKHCSTPWPLFTLPQNSAPSNIFVLAKNRKYLLSTDQLTTLTSAICVTSKID